MIRLKNILTESIDFKIKKSPNSFTNAARSYGGNAFRLKLIGQDGSTPKFSDIERVLSYNPQFGPSSKYSNGKYIFVISDDLRKSERKNFYDIAIYPTDKIPTTAAGETPINAITPTAKIGSSIMTTIEEFKKYVPDMAAKIAPDFKKAGEDVETDINDKKPETELNTSNKINNVTVISTNDSSSINLATNNADQLDPYSSNVIDTKQDVLVAATKQDLINSINGINSNSNKVQIEALQHLLANFLKSEVAKHPEYNSKKFLKTKISSFLSQPEISLYDGKLGKNTKGAIYIVNALYSGYTKEQFKAMTAAQLSVVTAKTIDILFTYKAANESRFSLKSIIFETYLKEQTPDFDLLDDVEEKYTKEVEKTQPISNIDKEKKDQKDKETKDSTEKEKQLKKEKPDATKDSLMRQKNGYLASKIQVESLDKEDSPNRWINNKPLKRLLYNKQVKIRTGIGVYEKGQFRGYKDVSDYWQNHVDGKVDWGIGWRNAASFYWGNVKVGDSLGVVILDVKVCIGGMIDSPYVTSKGVNPISGQFYTYVYVQDNKKNACWLPTKWIEIV
jgi:hypothetical protein